MKKTLNQLPDLGYLNLSRAKEVFYQFSPAQLVESALKRHEGTLADTGALAIDTGKFTGRSPKDRFIVEDDITRNTVWWGDVNIKFDAAKFDSLYNKMTAYLSGKEIFVRDACACAKNCRAEKVSDNVRTIYHEPAKRA